MVRAVDSESEVMDQSGFKSTCGQFAFFNCSCLHPGTFPLCLPVLPCIMSVEQEILTSQHCLQMCKDILHVWICLGLCSHTDVSIRTYTTK